MLDICECIQMNKCERMNGRDGTVRKVQFGRLRIQVNRGATNGDKSMKWKSDTEKYTRIGGGQ